MPMYEGRLYEARALGWGALINELTAILGHDVERSVASTPR